MKQQSLMLIDGMALLFRGYFATAYSGRIRRTKDGVPTNGIHSFVRYMWDAIETFNPTHVICCWDMGGETFRTQMFPDYKKNRDAPPEDLIPQFDLVKDVVSSFNVPNVGIVNYEADDVIGTLAREYSPSMPVSILTGDHDSLQLINDRTSVIIMKKGMSNYKVYTPEVLLEDKGLSPEQIIDLKGLMGDSSDNYPGVKGIGEKTALKLLTAYKNIEGILDNLEELANGLRKKIESQLDMLHLSRELATIKCDVPVSCHLDDAVWDLDYDKLEKQFFDLEFRSLLTMIKPQEMMSEKLNG